MADAATVRREARRRKILENSHNRLQLISGKNDNETCQESPVPTPIPIETIEYSVPKEGNSTNKCSINNGMINASEETFNFLSTNLESFSIGDGDVLSNHELAAFLSPSSTTPTQEPTQTPSSLEKIANYKYDIVLLSFLIQLFNWFSLVTFEDTYFFLPLILYVMTKNYWFPKQHNNTIVANALLLLNGMSASRVQKFMSITQYVSAFSQDVCVFLFTTICIHSLYQNIKDGLA